MRGDVLRMSFSQHCYKKMHSSAGLLARAEEGLLLLISKALLRILCLHQGVAGVMPNQGDK